MKLFSLILMEFMLGQGAVCKSVGWVTIVTMNEFYSIKLFRKWDLLVNQI